MNKKKTYIALDTNFSHTAIYFIKADTIDEAIENYCKEQTNAKKYKNGRWRWGNDYYESAKYLLDALVTISFEIKILEVPKNFVCEEVFAGIDWYELFYNWNEKDFYMRPRKRVGKFYEWYFPEYEYYALYPTPNYISKRIKKHFGTLESTTEQ